MRCAFIIIRCMQRLGDILRFIMYRLGDSTGSGRVERTALAMFAAGVLATAGVVLAVDDSVLEIDRVDGTGWHAEGVVARVELPQGALRFNATVGRLWFDAPARELRNVRVECHRARISSEIVACDDGTVLATLPAIGAQSLRGRVEYARRSGNLRADLDGFALGDGRGALDLTLADNRWHAIVRLTNAPVEALVEAGRALGAALPRFSATGRVALSLDAHGVGAVPGGARFDVRLADLTANNETGNLATDKLTIAFAGTLARRGPTWSFDVRTSSAQGQAYVQPIFLDLGVRAASVTARGEWNTASKAVSVEHFDVDHAQVIEASGRGTLMLGENQPLRTLALKVERLSFPGAYESYMQPLLLDTSFKAMKTSGSIAGDVSMEAGEPQSIDMRFDSVSLDDGARNFAVDALAGDWHWRNRASGAGEEGRRLQRGVVLSSTLRWEAAALLKLGIGSAQLTFETAGREFRLLEPTHIPLLDGAIDLESFRIRNVGQPNVAFIIDATIEPISAAQLCDAFGWPRFGGQVGGVISKLRMREGVISLGTTLEARVFDGDVSIRDLRLEQPFGQWPKFSSSIALRNLDLELVTGAFSFGRITGRLSGEIDGLQLFNWTPVAFDARLYTPQDDRSRHRISQRAVENIGSIGGGSAGVTAALSSGFLRFFDEFNYERLGISCRLANEVCVMDGTGAAPNGGYYLVKGQGVPRIDVIGSAHRVDWPRLVQQLIAATKSGGPVLH